VIVDDDVVSYFIINIYVGGDEGPQKFRVPLNEMVESLCDLCGDVAGYDHLYVVSSPT
jgi:hypothetical protein